MPPRAAAIAAEIGPTVRGRAIDLASPETIATALAEVSTFNGGVSTLTKTLAAELAPHRVNCLHSSVVGDSLKWKSSGQRATDSSERRSGAW